MQERGSIIDTDGDYSQVKNAKSIIRLDLACGERKQEGFLGVDVKGVKDVDIVANLEAYPWDFESDSVMEIRASHYLEHTKDIKSFMEECYRILAQGGIATFTCPYYTSIRATMDFTHTRFISENTFLYFNQPWLKSQLLSHYNITCDFDIEVVKYAYGTNWEARANDAREWARVHYNNVVQDIIVQLRAVKPIR